MRQLSAAAVIVLVLFSLSITTTPTFGSPGSNSSWVRTLPATATEGFSASSVEQTSDGGYIVAGSTISSQLLARPWLLRLDATGGIAWQKAYGNFSKATSPEGFPPGPRAVQTPDGGFIVSATTNASLDTAAAWVFRVDASGNLIWQEAFAGVGNALAFSIDTTPDGGFLVAGTTYTTGGFLVVGTALVLRLNSDGSVEWQKTYAGQGFDFALSIHHTSDGGAIVSGGTGLASGLGISNGWLLRLDSEGSIVWQRVYAGTVDFFSVDQTSDGGFVSTGVGDPTSTKTELFILRVDSSGNSIWQKYYGGTIRAVAYSIRATSNGGSILAGSSGTSSAPFTPQPLVVRIDALGNIVWQRNFLTARYSQAFSAVQTSNGGFAVVGSAFLTAPPPPSPGIGALVFKLDSKGVIRHCTSLSNSSLVASNASLAPTPITSGSVVISASRTVTEFVSVDTSTSFIVICQHGFEGQLVASLNS